MMIMVRKMGPMRMGLVCMRNMNSGFDIFDGSSDIAGDQAGV